MVLQLNPEVKTALDEGRPIVALESTLICHGIPRPRNLELARDLEATVRRHGAVPATIALIDGMACIGLDDSQLERIATADDVEKASVNSLAAVLARKRLGATTVASTIYIAGRAGIRFMATGGIGGVHRGGEISMDVSADLYELQRSKLVVVAAGAKIILDLERTMEALESLGVTLVGHGTGRLPGFYVEHTDHAIARFDDAQGIASVIRAQAGLGWPGSILVCNPPPRELAMERQQVEQWLNVAVDEMRHSAIGGKDETPYLLRRLAELSGGKTVSLNEQLVLANAKLAAQLASLTESNNDLFNH